MALFPGIRPRIMGESVDLCCSHIHSYHIFNTTVYCHVHGVIYRSVRTADDSYDIDKRLSGYSVDICR